MLSRSTVSVFSLLALSSNAAFFVAPRASDSDGLSSEFFPSTNSPINNVTFVEAETYPWFTALYEGSSRTCGGSLVAPDFVLTAANCIIGVDANSLEVHIGALTYTVANNGDQYNEYRDVSAIFQHPDYDPVPSDNDYALLQLSGASTITPVGMDGYNNLSEQFIGKK